MQGCVCYQTRTLDVLEAEGNVFWRMAKQEDLKVLEGSKDASLRLHGAEMVREL